MDAKNGKRKSRFYEFLPDLVDIIDDCIKYTASSSEKYDQQLKDLHSTISQIRNNIEKKSFVNFDPVAFLDDMNQDAIKHGNRNFRKSYNYIKKIRQIFFSNQEIRNANLISSFHSTILSNADSSEYQEKIDHLLENQNQSLSRSPALNSLVDSSLRPIYSTYFHLYEPKYFPSSHKEINSYYISSLLPILIKGNSTSSISAYESELINTKDMLEYLISYSVNSRTEYELFELRRKLPNPKAIMDSPIYLQKKDELDNVVKLFQDMLANYDRQFDNLKNVYYQRLKKAEDENIRVTEEKMKLSILHKKVETVSSNFRVLKYINDVFENQQDNSKPMAGPIQPSLTSLFQPLREWSDIQDSLFDTLNCDIPSLKDMETCLSDLTNYDTKLQNALSILYNKEKLKEAELNNSHSQLNARNANFDMELYSKLDETEKRMDKIHNDAFQDNMERIRKKSETKNVFDWHVCSISRIIERKPISNLMEPLINLSDPSRIENDNSEIKRRMKEIDELNLLLKKRQEEIENDRKIILDFSNERKEEEKVKKEKAKNLTIAAIDEKYTEARMFVSCMNCDSLSEFLAKPCKCKICKKCFEKSKKKRTSYCPVCGQVVEKFIKINW